MSSGQPNPSISAMQKTKGVCETVEDIQESVVYMSQHQEGQYRDQQSREHPSLEQQSHDKVNIFQYGNIQDQRQPLANQKPNDMFFQRLNEMQNATNQAIVNEQHVFMHGKNRASQEVGSQEVRVG